MYGTTFSSRYVLPITPCAIEVSFSLHNQVNVCFLFVSKNSKNFVFLFSEFPRERDCPSFLLRRFDAEFNEAMPVAYANNRKNQNLHLVNRCLSRETFASSVI